MGVGVVCLDGPRLLAEEAGELIRPSGDRQDLEVPYEDPLEGLSVATDFVAAFRPGAWLAQHSAHCEMADRGPAYSYCCVQQRGILRCLVELGKTGHQDALVVAPGPQVVVGAACGQPVVDHVALVDHPAVPEPVPLGVSPVQVLGVTPDGVMQP